MDNQFSDLSMPNVNDQYYCANGIQSTGFTHLMKLVLCVNKFPESINLIKKIICESSEEINKQNEVGFSALTIACFNPNTDSDTETVKLLIDAGADVNLRNNYGWSALMCAQCNQNTNIKIEIIKLLIDANADVNLQDNRGLTSLMYECKYSNNRNNEAVKLLLNANADVNLKDKTNIWTSLMFACRWSNINGNNETVKLLIDAGSDVNIKNDVGNTPLMEYLDNINTEQIDMETLMSLIIKSKYSLHLKNIKDKSSYDIYIGKNFSILDDYQLKLLKGDIVLNNTKSAK